MSEQTENATLQYPLTDTPKFGSYTEVAAGVYWLRLPLPFELNHINVWLLDDGDGWTLVDSGVALPATKAAWERLFNSGLGIKPIRRLIVTHLHPDHFGLARWLCDRYRVELHATEPTIRRAARLLRDYETIDPEWLGEFFRANGAADPAALIRFTTGHTYRRIVSGLPEHTRLISAEMEILIGGRSWRAILSHGHAEGHLSLYCGEAGILISGDQILPTITSNISLFEDDPTLNPLQLYLDCMADFRRLPAATLVLPSHGKIFRGLHARIDAIQAAHLDRSAQVLALCRTPSSVSQVAARLFPQRLDEVNACLAFGETFSHLRYLEKQRRLSRVSDHGVCLFQDWPQGRAP